MPSLFKNISPFRAPGGAPGGARELFWIIALGFFVRLFACQYTDVINPDGANYIHQARAIHYGLWQAVNACSLTYLSIVPICTAGLYPLFGDWIQAATAVSLLFGTATLAPLYGLAREFFDRPVASLVTLIFAVTPVFIDGSVDIVRDPACWFFLTSALYFLTRKEAGRVATVLGSVCMLLAAWTRVESFVFYLVTLVFLGVRKRGGRGMHLVLFLTPPVVLVALAVLGAWWFDLSGVYGARLSEIPVRLARALDGYRTVSANLTGLILQPPDGIPADFFDHVRDIFWFVGFGVLLQNALEAYYYPFFLIFLLGWRGIGKRIRTDGRVAFFVALILAAFAFLYLFVYIDWQMDNRWLAPMVLSSFPIMGFGVERVLSFLRGRCRMTPAGAAALLCLLVLVAALPKDLRPRGEDKGVYKAIGMTIARHEGNAREIPILTLDGSTTRWIAFYANLGVPGAPCPDAYYPTLYDPGTGYAQFIDMVRRNGFRYVVWMEKRWPRDRFDWNRADDRRDLKPMGRWRHRDVGEIRLYEVRR